MRTFSALTIALALTLSACSGGDDTTAPSTDTTAEQPADDEMADDEMADDEMADDEMSDDEMAAGGSVTFVGTDGVAWESDSASTAAGSNDLTLECGEAVPHGLAIEGVQDGAELAACGETATVELEVGEYTFFCTVPGHREGGMEGTLTVG